MIARGCVGLAVLVNLVFSVPVSPGHKDDKDVKVMKCIVEVIVDALSKPHPIPVSQDCLETLSTDDRLMTILRHHNFLRELQEIAEKGANERALKHSGDIPDHVNSLPKDMKSADDKSMLVAMEKPVESTDKRGAREESSIGSETTEQEFKKRNKIAAEEEEHEEDDSDSNHIPNSMNSEQKRESQEEATIGDKEKQEQEKKRSSSEKEEENDQTHNHKEGAMLADALEVNPEVKQSIMDKRAEKEGTTSEEEKRDFGVKRWSHMSKLAHQKVEISPALDNNWEAPHHTKEQVEKEGEFWRSPEEQELQLMAQTEPEDKRDEEGSASRKTEDVEIESLAAIESELENVAQKLHELRRG
ncbi:chromogranin-A-like [Myxocyprinus asiaticus]|uniref:chromogranin-A-like n=1 Tax=Myxocyprinus asiaticus TaxID=70543 RepID=UPI002223C522|nr:chromogranin-A-like [Myxocyprinus asiaticus]